MARTPNWKKNKVTSQNIPKSSKVDISSVELNELPSYARVISKRAESLSMSIPQEYIFTFSKGNASLLKELKKLKSLISSQTFTFRAASKIKLYKQINETCETIFAIMMTFLETYKKMHNEYIGSNMKITNFNEVNSSFAPIIACYHELLELVEKIKDESVKGTWKNKLNDFKMGKVERNGSTAKEYLDKITTKIVKPTIDCAKLIVAYERAVKKYTQDIQYSLKKDVDYLNEVRSRSKKYIPEILNLCQAGIDKTSAKIKEEWVMAEKGDKKRQLSKLEDAKTELGKLQACVNAAGGNFKRISDMADVASKKVKYGESNIDVITELKRDLKQMVDSANEVFAIIENPKTTEKQRMDKINAAIQEVEKGKKFIDLKVAKIKWNNEDPKTTEIIALINKSIEKFEELNNGKEIWEIRKTLVQWNKAKPSAFIAFIQKYGKLILMALGFLVTIL